MQTPNKEFTQAYQELLNNAPNAAWFVQNDAYLRPLAWEIWKRGREKMHADMLHPDPKKQVNHSPTPFVKTYLCQSRKVNPMHYVQGRTYKKGRPTTGWCKGERITSLQQVKPGDVLIGVNHQFKAENLYLVIPSPHPQSPHHDQGFYVRYVLPDLTPTHTDFQPQWIWGFQLEQDEWFKATPSE